MPIDRYGILKGQVVDCRVETGDTPHYQIHLRAGGIDYRAAVNVRSAQQSADLLFLLDLDGWALVDRGAHRQSLAGTVPPGAAVAVRLEAPVQLGNGGGTITLVDGRNVKADGAGYTRDQASREGWTVVFGR